MKRLSFIKKTISGISINLDNIETFRVQISNNIATVWFNKEASFNSISIRMMQELQAIIPILDAKTEVKLIVFRSKHPKVFCAGADLKDVFFNNPDKANSHLFAYGERTFRSFNKPIIAVVEGAAFGGGFQLSLLCDLIICSDKASFVLPQINLGLIPGFGGTQHLSRIVGSKIAMQKILAARFIKAREAEQLNIAICYPSESFEHKLSEFFDKLLNKASKSLQTAKKAINSAMETTLQQGLLHQASLFQGLFNKECTIQGLSAFVEKRKPNFRNI